MASNVHFSKNKQSELPWLVAAAAMAAVCLLAALASAHSRMISIGPKLTDADALWSFLASFAAATVILLLLLKKFRSSKLFSLLYLLSVALGCGYLAAELLGPDAAILAASAAVLLQTGWRIVAVRDAVLVAGLAGLAAAFGDVMTPLVVLSVLVILSFYDIIAVYGTKHMVTMTESLLRHKAVFAMILPSRASGFAERVDRVEPGKGFVFLGTGDFALPAILVASVARQSTVLAAMTTAGAILGIGLLRTIFIGKKSDRPMPALPPVAACAILGYAIAFLLI